MNTGLYAPQNGVFQFERFGPTDRVKRLTAAMFECPMQKERLWCDHPRRQRLLFIQGWMQYAQVYSTRLRRAYAEAWVLKNMRPVIDDDELIVGTMDLGGLTEAEKEELESSRPEMLVIQQGLRAHMTLDWPKLLGMGINGLVEEIKEHRAALDLSEPENLSKDEFYEGCLAELGGLLDLARSYVEHAKELAKTAKPERAAELLEIADILSRVPAGPARTFREGLQAIHFYEFCLWDLYYFGRLDQYLIGLYREDVRKGILTQEIAQELIDNFICLFTKNMTPQVVQVITIAGRDEEGRVVENELTYLFMQAAVHVHAQVTNIMFLYGTGHSDGLLRFALDLLSEGHANPYIFNDDLLTKSLLKHGFGKAESYHYTTAGCVEIVPCLCSGIWPVRPYHNLVPMLLEAMQKSVTALDEPPPSLDILINNFGRILKQEVTGQNLIENRKQMERMRNGNEVLRVSCLVRDCLEKGKSIDEGGARYNHTYPDFLGFANVVDSLIAIDNLVYKNRELSIPHLIEILNNNYEGYEELRQKIINKLPHWGTNEKTSDGMADRISKLLIESCEGLKTYKGRFPLVPGNFTYIMHIPYGKITPATPDGRKAGTALAAGSSPVQGREVEGPTAALLSAAAYDQAAYLGGIANNIMFSKKQLDENGKEKIAGLVKAFFSKGGTQIQINVVDKETLLDAQKHPEQYRDLIVRVGGFNAYFTGCEPKLQQEIIDRTEHAI